MRLATGRCDRPQGHEKTAVIVNVARGGHRRGGADRGAAKSPLGGAALDVFGRSRSRQTARSGSSTT